MTADITLRGPDDVIAVLPYQLGYHPRDCVVAVSLRDRRVGLVARTDLPPPEHAGAVVDGLVGPLLRDGATSVIVVGYEDVPDASQPVTPRPRRAARAGRGRGPRRRGRARRPALLADLLRAVLPT